MAKNSAGDLDCWISVGDLEGMLSQDGLNFHDFILKSCGAYGLLLVVVEIGASGLSKVVEQPFDARLVNLPVDLVAFIGREWVDLAVAVER